MKTPAPQSEDRKVGNQNRHNQNTAHGSRRTGQSAGPTRGSDRKTHATPHTGVRALHPSTGDDTLVIHLVELQHGQRHLFLLVLVLFGLGVVLFFLLLTTTTTQPEHQVQSGLLLNVVVSKGTAILQLLTGKDQSLLIRGDTLLVLDLGLHILDGIVRLNLMRSGVYIQETRRRSVLAF